MRFVDVTRALALLSVVGLLSGCPKKDAEATPEPSAPSAQPTNDKAGADAPAAAAPAAPAPKKKDEGGW